MCGLGSGLAEGWLAGITEWLGGGCPAGWPAGIASGWLAGFGAGWLSIRYDAGWPG